MCCRMKTFWNIEKSTYKLRFPDGLCNFAHDITDTRARELSREKARTGVVIYFAMA